MNPLVLSSSDDKITLTWVTDIHLSAIPPGKRAAGYEDQIFDKLEFVRDLCVSKGALCLCGGDIFHVKNPKSLANPLRMINRLTSLIKTFPYGMWPTCIGNHDIQYDRMDTVSNQPIGVLIEAGVCHSVNAQPVLIQSKSGDVKVLIESFDYAEGKETEKALLATKPRPEGIDYRIALVHAAGAPGDSRDQYGGSSWLVGYENLKGLDFDLMLWGHDHSRIETVSCGGITHINSGALSRASLTESEVDRKITVPVLTFSSTKASLKEVVVPCLPANQIFRIEDRSIEKIGDNKEVIKFFSAMNESVEHIESSDPAEVVDLLCGNDRALSTLVKDLCEL